MILTRTPFRMSFMGGGSDLKEFYSKNPGCVISTTINKYMYIFVHPFFDDQIQIKYSKTELVSDIKDIQHPIVKEVLKVFNINGIDINSIADIPAGTGLGSSSAYTVGILNALYNYVDQQKSKDELARKACEIEIDTLKEPIGKQDQYATSYGGLNMIQFLSDGQVKVTPIEIENTIYKKLENNLLLFYTGKVRSASYVLYDQKKSLLSEKDKFDSLVQMTNLVKEAITCLKKSNTEKFGKILNENWHIKKTLSDKISNPDIDEIYSLAIKAGALGGKLLGAGGGGFLLFYCPLKKQEKLRLALRNLKEVDFSFDNTGSTTIKLNN